MLSRRFWLLALMVAGLLVALVEVPLQAWETVDASRIDTAHVLALVAGSLSGLASLPIAEWLEKRMK